MALDGAGFHACAGPDELNVHVLITVDPHLLTMGDILTELAMRLASATFEGIATISNVWHFFGEYFRRLHVH